MKAFRLAAAAAFVIGSTSPVLAEVERSGAAAAAMEEVIVTAT